MKLQSLADRFRRHVAYRWAARRDYRRRDVKIGDTIVSIVGPFARPFDIALDAAGQVYVAEFAGHAIVRLSSELSFAGWLGGGVSAWRSDRCAAAPGTGDYAFRRPHSVDVDGDGRLYIADLDNARIQVYSADGEYERTFGHGILAGPASARCGGDGTMLVCDAIGNRLMRFDSRDAVMSTIAAGFNQPHTALAAADGTFVVADTWNHRIVRVAPDGKPVGTIGHQGPGSAPGTLDAPVTVASDGSGGFIVAEYGNHRIQRFAADGRYLGWIGRAQNGIATPTWRLDGVPAAGSGPGAFRHPYGARLFQAALYVADTENNRIQIIRPCR